MKSTPEPHKTEVVELPTLGPNHDVSVPERVSLNQKRFWLSALVVAAILFFALAIIFLLTQAKSVPVASATTNGITLKVTHVYFDTNRAVLNLTVDASGYGDNIGPPDPRDMTITDDKGQILNISGDGIQPPLLYFPLLDKGLTYLVSPVPTGTKNLTLVIKDLIRTAKPSGPDRVVLTYAILVPGPWQFILPVTLP